MASAAEEHLWSIRSNLQDPARQRAPHRMHRQVSVYYTWERLGFVAVDEIGAPRLPSAPARPGVFRLVAAGDRPWTLHLGSADNLRETFAGMNDADAVARWRPLRGRLVACLRAGEPIAADAITFGVIIPPDEPPRPADLTNPVERQLLSLLAQMTTDRDLAGGAGRAAGRPAAGCPPRAGSLVPRRAVRSD